jgi:hypothetical protein
MGEIVTGATSYIVATIDSSRKQMITDELKALESVGLSLFIPAGPFHLVLLLNTPTLLDLRDELEKIRKIRGIQWSMAGLLDTDNLKTQGWLEKMLQENTATDSGQ